jgi:hypothetical protein
MELLLGVILGAVVVWMAPNLVGNLLRPAAKKVIKGSVAAYKATADAAAEAKESVGDLVAEAKSEMPGTEAKPPATKKRRAKNS